MYTNPYENLNGGSWRKVNFHTHAGTGSGCGKYDAKDVFCEYEKLGYDAICFSNHNVYVDYNHLASDKLKLIDGNEYTRNGHFLMLGSKNIQIHLDYQEAIDSINSDNGICILCHPEWDAPTFWSFDDWKDLHGYIGIEVFNKTCGNSGTATCTWDKLLSMGRLVWGFANDDWHEFDQTGFCYNLIYTNDISFEGLKQAVLRGQFVASTGVFLEEITLIDNEITVLASYNNEQKLNYQFITENGEVKAETFDTNAKYKLNSENYIRIEVTSSDGKKLCLQPIYKNNFLKLF